MVHRYPFEAAVRDGRRVLIRPFTGRDTDALYGFFKRLPAELRRCAWDRIEDRGLIETWGQSLDYARAFPLLALDGTRIVADASLHRRDAGPLRLVGRVKWLLDPEWRGCGLGSLLVNHFIASARVNGLRHLTCMLISDLERDAIRTLKEVGFEEFTFADYGTDPDGQQHDMTKLILRL